MAKKFLLPSAVFVASAMSVPTLLASGGAAYASGPMAAANLSGNAFFPLVVGATWKYKEIGGATGASELTVHVAGAHKTPSGEAVDVQDTMGAGTFSVQYTVGANGVIEVEASTGSGSTKMTINGTSNYFIPSASQVASCYPCRFSANFTIAVSHFSVREHLAETATSAGAQTVSVPAGTFHAEKLQMAMKVTSAVPGVPVVDTISYALYLVKGVGVVETGAGTSSTSVMGRVTNASTGSEELLNYTP